MDAAAVVARRGRRSSRAAVWLVWFSSCCRSQEVRVLGARDRARSTRCARPRPCRVGTPLARVDADAVAARGRRDPRGRRGRGAPRLARRPRRRRHRADPRRRRAGRRRRCDLRRRHRCRASATPASPPRGHAAVVAAVERPGRVASAARRRRPARLRSAVASAPSPRSSATTSSCACAAGPRCSGGARSEAGAQGRGAHGAAALKARVLRRERPDLPTTRGTAPRQP